MGLIPGLGRSPGRGNGNPLQYSWLKKIPWTEEPSGLTVHGVTKELDMTEQLSTGETVAPSIILNMIL